MRTNVKLAYERALRIRNGNGLEVPPLDSEDTLRRAVMSCLLFEDSFYINGEAVADVIERCITDIAKRSPQALTVLGNIVFTAKVSMKLRHVPLFMLVCMLKHFSGDRRMGDLVYETITRPDDMTELLALYWKHNKTKDGQNAPLSNQLKQGLARAFRKFNEYSLAKYNRDNTVKLRDVLFLSHAKPQNEEQDALWKKLIDGKMEIPDTWETQLSAGKDKAEVFTRLMEEKKLGALATLRNLRNMVTAGVSYDTIEHYVYNLNADKLLPFQFISAARAAPQMEPALEKLMFKCLDTHAKLSGTTILLVDHSGSMNHRVSAKSDITRFDVACGLAIILRELCERVHIYAFSGDVKSVPARRGFALADATRDVMEFDGTYMGSAITKINKAHEYDRLICITDEQSADRLPPAQEALSYIINMDVNRVGVNADEQGYFCINGWSEGVIEFIRMYEARQ